MSIPCAAASVLAALGLLSSLPAHADDASRLDQVVVTAARVAQTAHDVIGDVTVLDAADIRLRNANSVDDLLRTLPGVQIVGSGGPGKATSVLLRGASSTQVLLLIDGMRVGSATAGGAAWHNLPVDQIERIEVLRGPASSLYGADAIGGVVQIFTRAGSGAPTPSLTVGVGTQGSTQFDAGYRGVTGPGGATRFAIGIADRRTDGVSAIANPANFAYNPDRDGYRNTSLSGQLTQTFSADHQAGVNLLVAQGRNHYDSSWPTANFDYRNNDQLASYSVWSRNRLTPLWSSQVSLGQSIDDSRTYAPVSATDLSQVESRFKTTQTQVTWQNDLKLAGGVTTLGVEHVNQKVGGDTAYVVTRRDIDSAFAGYVGNFAQWTVQGNLRADHNSGYGSKTTGHAALAYRIAPDWQLGAAAGTAFRAPTFNELYYPGFANPDLRPEQSRTGEVFARYDHDGLVAGLTVYRNRVTDLIANSGVNFLPINIGRANLEGATLNVDWNGKLGAQTVDAGASLDLASPRDASGGANDGKLLARRARQFGTVHAGTRDGAWQWRAEVTGQGQRFDNAANSSTQVLAGYGIVNLSAAYTLTPDWTARVRVDNLFGRRYELAKDYGVVREALMLSLSWQPARP